MGRLIHLGKRRGYVDEKLKKFVFDLTGKTYYKDLTKAEYDRLYEKLHSFD